MAPLGRTFLCLFSRAKDDVFSEVGESVRNSNINADFASGGSLRAKNLYRPYRGVLFLGHGRYQGHFR